MKDIALVRSMTNREGEHQRATYQMHTGYVPLASVKHPSLGAIVASEIAPREFDLPHFVSVGNRATTLGSGFLGMQFAPFIVQNANADAQQRRVARRRQRQARFTRRLDLMKDLEQDFADAGGGPRVEDHQAVYASAAQMVLSPRLKAFDVSQEKDAVRDRYGRSPFGQGCLLARRLVEAGVTFVEVESNGWDTHQDNFTRVEVTGGRRGSGLRRPGRRPEGARHAGPDAGDLDGRVRPDAAHQREHRPRPFPAGLQRGPGRRRHQGRPGHRHDQRRRHRRHANGPVSVADLFCTFCQALEINPRKENIGTLGRPIKLVDGGAAVKELF